MEKMSKPRFQRLNRGILGRIFDIFFKKEAWEVTLCIRDHIVLFTKFSMVIRYDGCEVEEALLCTYFGGLVRCSALRIRSKIRRPGGPHSFGTDL